MSTTKNFILIDDEPTCNFLSEVSIKRVFQNSHVSAFTDPEAGLKFIKEIYQLHPIEAVLFLDINMPKWSGWDVLEKISHCPLEVTNKLKIYVLSSSVDPEDRRKAAESSFVKGFIEKPITRVGLQNIFND
jgi:two-component system chemotaxis response regulator CheY